jgi:hypothetical protein
MCHLTNNDNLKLKLENLWTEQCSKSALSFTIENFLPAEQVCESKALLLLLGTIFSE